MYGLRQVALCLGFIFCFAGVLVYLPPILSIPSAALLVVGFSRFMSEKGWDH